VPRWDHLFDNWLWHTDGEDAAPEASEAVVFDLDGVLSDASRRQHFIEHPRRDWEAFFHACGDDELIAEVARLLEVLDPGLSIVLLTARPIRVLPQTAAWLERYGLRWDLLVMRDFGDYQAARSFKQRTVGELRSRGFELRLAFEDDPRNVAMFHDAGVPCVYIHSGYYE
jgi:phosphoglycolate phosphatase-like HAD superfamily hydrolase